MALSEDRHVQMKNSYYLTFSHLNPFKALSLQAMMGDNLLVVLGRVMRLKWSCWSNVTI